ncbi:MAG: phenylalanine--tRNA ligase subunit beta [Candidatus Moranbacteria bacterium]|nr:phenylalanine--tRNA ligase subunit beta [Candidatus Moranbacteria bacterium]
MKYLYSWIKELSNTNLSPQELAQKMTKHAFEVEEVKKIGGKLEGVVVGHVLEVASHPDANRLRVARVDVGTEKLQIVCGAPNLSKGQKVPVALIGTVLPGDFKIKKSKIRGIESCGMICAEDELGLGSDHEGIMVLNENAQIGKNLSDELDLKEDYIIDLDILSNRGHDMMGHVGLVREISAVEGREMDYDYESLNLAEMKAEFEDRDRISVKIENEKLCPRYTGILIEGIKVTESPDWLKKRLKVLGENSINNIVDATNYVMIELGQPMHAFDADKIGNKDGIEIHVRNARKKEKIILLDGTDRELASDDLVIANENEVLALAGVMGGENSRISENTKNILLESANLNSISVRKSRMRHGLKTQSSDRFEKELDPNLVEKAARKAVDLIKEIAGGQEVDLLDVYPNHVEEWKIDLNLDYVDRLLGCEVEEKKVRKILESLKMKVEDQGERVFEVTIPTFRIDLQNQEDLIEEIGRIYGYDHVEPQEMLGVVRTASIDSNVSFEMSLKKFMVGFGFSETYAYSFYSKKDAEIMRIDEAKHFELEHPMNPSQELMRLSLIPGMLNFVRENLKNFSEIRLFEIGREYYRDGDSAVEEKRKLVGAVVLEADKKAETFFEAKGFVSELISKMGIYDFYFQEADGSDSNSPWHPSRSAVIHVGESGETIGRVGEIDLMVLEEYSIKKRVAMLEIDTEKLKELSQGEREFEPIRKYPDVTRDISMLCGSDVRVDDILSSIQGVGGELILDVDLFDIFEIEGENKNSFAFRIIFGSKERTLERKEVDTIMEGIMNELETNLGVEVRK